MTAASTVVDVDGVTVRLWSLGPAGRAHDPTVPTVLMVHGIGMSHRSFRRLQGVFARSWRTVAVDLPGHGGLPAPGRRLRIADFAGVVMRALPATGTAPLVVIGHSMGVQIAVEIARTHPGRVASVVLIGPVVDDQRRTVLQQAVGLFRDGFVEGIRMNAVMVTDYVRSIRQYPSALIAMMRYPLRAVVEELRVPVLAVRGSVDPIARHDWLARVVGAAADGALVEVPGPHQVQEHRPAAVADAVEEFLRTRTPEGRR